MLRNPGVVETDLGDEVVLLDPHTRAMFSLNATGRVVWQYLDEGTEAITARLVGQFEVSGERARSDVALVLADLRSAGLIQDPG